MEGTDMPLPFHITMEGEKQGEIEGSCEMLGRERSLVGYWLVHRITAPHDPVEGTLTAKASHYPLKLIIELDKCSPKLHQALCTGEHMKYVNIDWYRVNKYGEEELYFTFHIKNATITKIESYMPLTFLPDTASLPYMEKLSFSYKYIRWTY
jgi:type VI secretion system secreted protein Hcp